MWLFEDGWCYDYVDFFDSGSSINVNSEVLSEFEKFGESLACDKNDELAYLFTTDWIYQDKHENIYYTKSQIQSLVYNKEDINSIVSEKANSADVYTKAEIDSRGYVTESQLSGKADVAAVENLQSVDAELSDRLTAIEDNLGE
jgi:hypothetical protein